MDPRNPGYGAWFGAMVAQGYGPQLQAQIYPVPAGFGAPAGQALPMQPQYGPWPTNANGVLPSLRPPSLNAGVGGIDPNFIPMTPGGQTPQIKYVRMDMSHSIPWMPYTENGTSGMVIRYPRLTVSCPTDVAVNVATNLPLQDDFPTAVVELTAAVRDLSGDGFSVGENPLDCFTVQAVNASSGDRWIPEATLGSAIFGTGRFPRRVVGPAWKLQAGGSPMMFTIVCLREDIRVDLVFACVETIIGSNYGK